MRVIRNTVEGVKSFCIVVACLGLAAEWHYEFQLQLEKTRKK